MELLNLSVLVVDDDDDTREVLSCCLEELGAKVTTASSAAQATVILSAAPFDVALLDIGLPDETGCSLLRRMRALGYELPTIAITGYVGAEFRAAVTIAGFDAHLQKPLDLDDLTPLITSVVAHGRSRRSRAREASGIPLRPLVTEGRRGAA